MVGPVGIFFVEVGVTFGVKAGAGAISMLFLTAISVVALYGIGNT